MRLQKSFSTASAISGQQGDGKKSGIFPERATKDSPLPHRLPVEIVSKICYTASA
jgi:hypothetical protein